MKSILFFLLFVLTTQLCYAQTYEEKAKRVALLQLNQELKKANVKHCDLRALIDFQQSLQKQSLPALSISPYPRNNSTDNLISSFNRIINNTDSLLSVVGVLKNYELNASMLIGFMEKAYDCNSPKADTLSTYYQLLELLYEFQKYPELIMGTSPNLQMYVLNAILPKETLTDDFYVFCYVAIATSVHKSFQDFIKNQPQPVDEDNDLIEIKPNQQTDNNTDSTKQNRPVIIQDDIIIVDDVKMEM